MDVTEIIECLNRRKEATGLALKYFSSDRAEKEYEALGECIELLKKHIQIEVSTNDLHSPLCPYCKKMFYTLYAHYCPNCSQALNWDKFFKAKKEILQD